MPIDQQPVAGQRWVSGSEPELGLGIILRAEFGRVEIFFPAANEHRQYALKMAPLRRVAHDATDGRIGRRADASRFEAPLVLGLR